MTTATEAPATGVQVGDLFSSSWGYDQTNVSYWRVVGVTPSGKSIKVQKCSTVVVEQGGPGGDRVVAGEPQTVRVWNDDYTEQTVQEAPVELKRLRTFARSDGRTEYSFSWSSFANAYKTDNTPKHQTDPIYGH